jgi:hypothetical protein
MQLSTRDTERIFKKLQIEVVSCKHHVRGFLVVDGRRVLPLHYSNGRKDLPGSVPHLFRKALHLTVEEFAVMVGCTMGRDEYVELLKQRNILT